MRGAALAIAAACTVGPSYRVPSAPVPNAARFKEGGTWRVASPGDELARGAWWTMFREPALDQLEARVEPGNQTIAAAYHSYMAALALIREAAAQWSPTATTSPSATVGRGTAVSSTLAGPGVFHSYSLPLEVSWAPDLFGRVRNQVREATATAQASAADFESQRLLEHATLAQTYFQLCGQDALAKLLDDTVVADEKIVEVARSRFETGVDTEVALVQAQQTLQTARVQATNARILRAQYEHAIATLIGVPATTFSLPKRPVLGAPPVIPVGTPSQLLERRPDVASAERKMAAANAAVGVAYAAYFPDVTLTGTIGLAASTITKLLAWPSRVWSLGATAAETLFDGGLRGATVDQMVANYNAAVATYRQTVLTAFQQVEDQLAALTVLAQEIAEQRANVALAARAFELEKSRYESGIDPYVELMLQQTILLAAQQALVNLQVLQLSAAVMLVESLGGGWDRSALR